MKSVLAELVAVDRSVGASQSSSRMESKKIYLWFAVIMVYHGHDIEHGMGGLRGAKIDVYEGGIRVPGIIEWPGKIKPRVTNFPACTTDIFPTIASILNLPEEPLLPAIDSIDLSPVFEKDLPKREKPMAFFNSMARKRLIWIMI